MSEMVERVAMAISLAFREEGAFWDGKWESESEQQEFLKCTSAAIAAMREPTEAMKKAGSAEAWHSEYDTSESTWHAMIDAALQEQEEK